MSEAVPIKAIIVSHTHWDRAWYQPFQTFRPFSFAIAPHAELSFLTLEPSILRLSAVKRAADQNRLIVRVYNPLPDPAEGVFRLFWPIHAVYETNLNEDPILELASEAGHIIRVKIGGKEVKTFAIEIDHQQRNDPSNVHQEGE